MEIKWHLGIDNPLENGYTHERIKELVNGLNDVEEWRTTDEMDRSKVIRTHIYVKFTSMKSSDEMKKKFPNATKVRCGKAMENDVGCVFQKGQRFSRRHA